MGTFKRFLTYINSYTHGELERNVGSSKVELRDNNCRITINAKGLMNIDINDVYLFRRESNNMVVTYLGKLNYSNGNFELRVETEVDNVLNTGFSFNDFSGIMLMREKVVDSMKRPQVMYAGIWDNKPLGNIISKKSLFVDNIKEVVNQPEERQNSINTYEEKVKASVEEKQEVFKDEMEEDQLENIKKFSMIEQFSNRKYRHANQVKMASACNVSDTNFTNNNDSEIKDLEKCGQTNKVREDEKRIKKVNLENCPLYYEDMNYEWNNENDIKNKTSNSVNTNTSLEDQDPRLDQTKEANINKILGSISETKDTIPVVSQTKQIDQAKQIENHIVEDTVIVNQVSNNSGIFMEDPEKKTMHQMVRNYSSDIEPITFLKNNENKEIVEANLCLDDRIDCMDIRIAKANELREKFKDENKKDASEVEKKVKYILEVYPKMNPFEDGCECVRIEPQDLYGLPISIWMPINNPFLKSGYSKFKHLVLTKNGSDYVIGVPGIRDDKEQFSAHIHGFRSFKPLKKLDNVTEEFGYWIVKINI